MPSAFGHAPPALTLVPLFRTQATPRRLWALGVACAVAPDLDVVWLGLAPHGTMLGHRGLTHSLAFAAALAALVAVAALPRASRGTSHARAWLYLFLATASHGLLDACTNGGAGVALFAPFSSERFFFPFRPIEVSPLSVARFLSQRGVQVLWSELVWVWLPCAVLALLFVLALAPRRQ
ncbi:MAG TPA: metal-dependent hydrolase [Myxococcota bacterium]|nr:metal-dependent hydrolase [Myxococcota bacterium]